MNFTATCPLNSLSFGFITYNLYKEFYKKGLSPNLFPIGPVDISCFDKCDPGFQNWLQHGYGKSLENYRKTDSEFRLWHVSGSDITHSNKQILLTFFECNCPSPTELNILSNQSKTFFTSQYTTDVFKSLSVNAETLHLGFDNENFYRIEKRPYGDEVTTWILDGKFESKRKRTDRLIRLWAKRWGNNPSHRLHVHCYNVHLHGDPNECARINEGLVNQALEGKKYWNIGLQNRYFGTLTEYNQFLNSGDIFLDASGNENWNFPAFNATALGKHLVTVYSNGVKEWANKENAVLVAPEETMEECYDGVFFHRNTPFNNGFFFNFSEDKFIAGMEEVLKRSLTSRINHEGLKIQNEFTWAKTANKILENL